MNYEARLGRLRERLAAESLNAMLVTNLINIRYLCGFTGSNAYLLVGAEGPATFFSDGRYKTQAAHEVADAEVQICTTHAQVSNGLAERMSNGRWSKIAFEGSDVTVSSDGSGWSLPPGLDRLETYFEGAKLVSNVGWVQQLRRLKEPEELEIMRKAAALADETFNYILSWIREGQTEKQIALEIEFHLRSEGADGVSFDPIVAAGERAALPHARPGNKTVERGAWLLLDFGCVYHGYCSDMTRTLVLGSASQRQRDVYEAVLASQAAGAAAVNPGATGGDADQAARDVLIDAGLGDYFVHSLGHGVGLEIHEAPTLRTGGPDVLDKGNVVTIEPGAYLEGWGGVRIEDLGLVTEKGFESLSFSPKELVVL